MRMTRQEVKALMDSIRTTTGCPVNLGVFKKPQTLPYIIWMFEGLDGFYADNTIFQKIETLTINFYSEKLDFVKESEIETALLDAGLVFTYQREYIESEKMYETHYESEVLING